ncbi:hypothetical protein [Asanoa siamensis]|uniref:Uncharacterized protein n=1 Tax=Asanoa siamensis TaxID=926357 RepID=A0ABQ4CUV9_9ACTN|nr:hypothetical protein [Asanoa siamensis]GIF75061.1 hypothetical protein Asi02nite_45790 [Asanoa siamensis]
MRVDWRGFTAMGVALGAAVLWAVDMAYWQPLVDLQGEFAFDYAENNTYWARDLRFSAIVAIALAIVLAGRGGRLARWLGPATGVAWIATDLLVDRADVAGGGAAAVLAIAGALVAVAVTGLVHLRAGRGEPRLRSLVISAAIAAALTPLVSGTESPTDAEAALTPAAATLGALLAVLTLALAATAAPDRAKVRWTVGGVVALGTVVAIVLCRVLSPSSRLTPMMLLGTLLLVGVALLSSDLPRGPPPWLGQLPKLLVLLVLYPALVLFMLLGTVYAVPVASWFTALSGNLAVNAADSDTLYALIGVITGTVIGWLLLAVNRVLVPAPAPAPAPAPEVTTAAR